MNILMNTSSIPYVALTCVTSHPCLENHQRIKLEKLMNKILRSEAGNYKFSENYIKKNSGGD